MLIFKISN